MFSYAVSVFPEVLCKVARRARHAHTRTHTHQPLNCSTEFRYSTYLGVSDTSHSYPDSWDIHTEPDRVSLRIVRAFTESSGLLGTPSALTTCFVLCSLQTSMEFYYLHVRNISLTSLHPTYGNVFQYILSKLLFIPLSQALMSSSYVCSLTVSVVPMYVCTYIAT